MTSNPAPMLSPTLVGHAKSLATAIRENQVAPLVGAGISLPSRLPTWESLASRIIQAWKEWDTDALAQTLDADSYVKLVRSAFAHNDLAFVSFLRRRLKTLDQPTFGQLLYAALYPGEVLPQPNHLHRHLIALAQDSFSRLWTTNYDDLLEVAANDTGVRASPLSPANRHLKPGFLVSHLHGFLPPRRDVQEAFELDPALAEVILAEDDYHAVAADVVGWTNREFHRIFDEYRVLIVGMSLSDPNVRRVLATLSQSDARPGSRHFAVMRSINSEDLQAESVAQLEESSGYANRIRFDYWERLGVTLIELPDRESLLPFLVRARFESYGDAPGALWRAGAAEGYERVAPNAGKAAFSKPFLQQAAAGLARDFGADDVVEVGLFLLRPRPDEMEPWELELIFRSGDAPTGRRFCADPDRPQGVAGRVFVSGSGVRVYRQNPLHDYGVNPVTTSDVDYRGIVSVPVIDWENGGVPLGVAYVTTAVEGGSLFRLPTSANTSEQRTLNDLYSWLQEMAMGVVNGFR